MGSDSRSATASTTKSRPKWRDKHLNQLSDEQLQEVQAHRGDVTGVADVAVSHSQMPKKQAGPDQKPHSSAKHSDRSRDHGRVTDADRSHEEHADRRSSGYHRDQRAQDDYPDQRRAHRPARESSGESAREYSDRSSGREPYRDDRHADNGRGQSRAPDAAIHNESAKAESGFAKLLKFKLSRPVKYGLMAVAIVAMLALSFFKPIDNSSQSQLDSAFTRAAIGFGLARTLNGVISVAQGTEFAVQPAGVGVNFSPGEILDPINDLVERFSWVMLLATSSIGVQQILLEVSSWAGISVLLGGAGLFFLLTRMRNSAIASLADVAGKLLLLMLLVRFLIPLGSLANDWVYKQFLEPRFTESSQQLELASERIREISTRQTTPEEKPDSLTGRAKNLYNSMTAKFDFDGMLNDYRKSAENVSEHAVNLIVVYVLQTVIFPLLFLYLTYRLFRSFLRPSRN